MEENPLARLWLLAQWPGVCTRCRKPFAAAARIAWYPATREARHPYCCKPGSADLVKRTASGGQMSDPEPVTSLPLDTAPMPAPKPEARKRPRRSIKPAKPKPWTFGMPF